MYSSDKSRWPKLPDLPESFTTNIEINIVDQNSTLDAVEYFDNFGNRVALHTTKEGLNGVVVYEFTTNEVFYVTRKYMFFKVSASLSCIILN